MLITVLPKILSYDRVLPRSYKVENWRKITLAEGKDLVKEAKELILRRYPDTSRVMLIGGVVDRGWTRRDIDLLLVSPSLYEEYKVKGELITYKPYGSKETYRVIKPRLEDWRVLSFEKEVERHVAYPTTVMVMKDDRELRDSWGVEVS
jgi:predicted nucleotidyltransferase